MHEYPTLAEVLAMHEQLLAELGSGDGVRDLGALDAALLRPQLGYYDTLIDEAAALMESLAMNHPFVDGNKPVAFFVTDTFLRMNGTYIDCDGEAAHAHFMTLFEDNAFRFHELRTWLLAHTRDA
jgi:death-on-curing protein